MHPGVEPIRIAELRQLAPGDHQRLLDSILGSADVPEDPLGDREQSISRRAGEDGEGLPIAMLRLLDQLAIHLGRLPGAPVGGAFHGA